VIRENEVIAIIAKNSKKMALKNMIVLMDEGEDTKVV